MSARLVQVIEETQETDAETVVTYYSTDGKIKVGEFRLPKPKPELKIVEPEVVQ